MDITKEFGQQKLFGSAYEKEPEKLAERFVVPPFSVLDAKQGYWQNRKRAWISLGISGEEGRNGGGRCFGQDLIKGENPNFAQKKGYGLASKHNKNLNESTQKALGCYAATHGAVQDRAGGQVGTSIFDPVLCELSYKWFCPPCGAILDPFAGESTKGIVATYLGFDYTGIELRKEQVEANYSQVQKINNGNRKKLNPLWFCGDSIEISKLLENQRSKYDMIFTSPPYYDLEIYSQSEKDGSAFETYDKFMRWYKDVFSEALSFLSEDRFLVIKVGEIRNKGGVYRNFVGDNIQCFIDLGLNYYNEIILLTSIGSLPVRVGKTFHNWRKIGKAHQNILVFFKGNPKNIKGLFNNENT